MLLREICIVMERPRRRPSIQSEVQSDGGEHFNRLSVEQRRTVAPLLHGLHSRLDKKSVAGDHPQSLRIDRPFARDDRFYQHDPLGPRDDGKSGVFRRDAMQETRLHQFSPSPNWRSGSGRGG